MEYIIDIKHTCGNADRTIQLQIKNVSFLDEFSRAILIDLTEKETKELAYKLLYAANFTKTFNNIYWKYDKKGGSLLK